MVLDMTLHPHLEASGNFLGYIWRHLDTSGTEASGCHMQASGCSRWLRAKMYQNNLVVRSRAARPSESCERGKGDPHALGSLSAKLA